jgi:hypothetical protein
MPGTPIRHLGCAIEVEGGALAQIVGPCLQEGVGRAAALVAQHGQEVPLGVQLGRVAEIDHYLARDAMNAHPGPARSLVISRMGDPPQQGNHA